eukprot:5365463-Pleurochrysis_carterae.AAC.2
MPPVAAASMCRAIGQARASSASNASSSRGGSGGGGGVMRAPHAAPLRAGMQQRARSRPSKRRKRKLKSELICHFALRCLLAKLDE